MTNDVGGFQIAESDKIDIEGLGSVTKSNRHSRKINISKQ